MTPTLRALKADDDVNYHVFPHVTRAYYILRAEILQIMVNRDHFTLKCPRNQQVIASVFQRYISQGNN